MLNNAKNVLLMSQSHGKEADWQNPDFEFVDAWSGSLGMTTVSPSIPKEERRHPWAAGLPTDDAVGYGGDLGWFPMSAQNVVDSGPHQCTANYSRNPPGGEFFYLQGSSGFRPLAMRLVETHQICGIGFFNSFGNPGTYSSGFKSGWAAEPVLGNLLACLSWGNELAPDANIGYWPSYEHTLGEARLWIVGYPWSQVEITSSAPDAMTRAHMLHNIIAWLSVDEWESP